LKRERATAIGEALSQYLARRGLKARVDQARVLDDWPELVGPQIARVTAPEGISEDGMLFVRVATAPWMQELQMQSPAILRQLALRGCRLRRIIWRLDPGGDRETARAHGTADSKES
jgi:predicted nucleic acid-binding Zn ribbon protein